MNCSAIPNTNANSSGRGTWVLLVRPTSSGTSETTKPSAATSAPSRLLLATWYAAVASKASRRSQLSQCTAIAQSMQVACPVGDEPAHPIGLHEMDEMPTTQAGEPGVRNGSRQLAPSRSGHHRVPGSSQHERRTVERTKPRPCVERQRQFRLDPISGHVGPRPGNVAAQEIAWKAQAELRRQRGDPSRAVHASTYPMTQETPHRQCHRSAARKGRRMTAGRDTKNPSLERSEVS